VLIALETSGVHGGVTLVDGDGSFITRDLQLGTQHAQSLLPAMVAVLESRSLSLRDVGVVAVSVGPGSFTGLRVGVVVAKTLAFATGCRIVAVNTFAAIADNAPDEIEAVTVLGDAQRSELYVQPFRRAAARVFEPTAPIAICRIDHFLDSTTQDRPVVLGPGCGRAADQLAERARLLDRHTWHPGSESIARRGLAAAARGEFVDPFLLEPVYGRRSSAEENRERRQAAEQPLGS
jgi:tRNA threonylcarbamoyladenosine biosynthesis protein TsaB